MSEVALMVVIAVITVSCRVKMYVTRTVLPAAGGLSPPRGLVAGGRG